MLKTHAIPKAEYLQSRNLPSKMFLEVQLSLDTGDYIIVNCFLTSVSDCIFGHQKYDASLGDRATQSSEPGSLDIL